jgi:hypothetical protein
MEYLVDRHHKNTTKVIGLRCVICQDPIVEGDYVVTKRRKRVFHKACWDGLFIEARKTSSEKWRKNHPEECRRRQKEWRRRNPEKVKAYRKTYRAQHPDKVKASRKRQYQKHCEAERAARRRRYQLHPYRDWTPEEKARHAEAKRNRTHKLRGDQGESERVTPSVPPMHRRIPRNKMPYTGDFTNGASWRSMRLCNLTVKKQLHRTVIFDIMLPISKSAFSFRSLFFP